MTKILADSQNKDTKDVEKCVDKILELKEKWDLHLRSLEVSRGFLNIYLIFMMNGALVGSGNLYIEKNIMRHSPERLSIELIPTCFCNFMFLVMIGYYVILIITHMKNRSSKEFKGLHSSPISSEEAKNECREELIPFKKQADAIKKSLKLRQNIYLVIAIICVCITVYTNSELISIRMEYYYSNSWNSTTVNQTIV